ncbi:hypothetical protein CBM2586_B130493 [Cupriavidus phytorum]|uniref:Uncharacterized protein n=1 Tax=Cupriavidus taiwanensis TaxID=164546 RepID=A0A375CJ78_9BURK|nr:hypothetical protein CBM2586_B130493 [Cupriavidus taiwanensis]
MITRLPFEKIRLAYTYLNSQ